MKQVVFNVSGMFCSKCSDTIQQALLSIEGVTHAQADENANQVEVHFDPLRVNETHLIDAISSAGYTVQSVQSTQIKSSFIKKMIPWAMLIALVLLTFIFKPLDFGSMNVDLSTYSYFALFMLGMAVSVHCIGMCGGIQLSVTLNTSIPKIWYPGVQYNFGRVLGYTLTGAMLGLIGEAISFTTSFKMMVSIFTGLLILMMGLNYIGLFKWSITPLLKNVGLRKFDKPSKNGLPPYLVGFLNAFIPCGPLQVIQLYALGSGSALTGALSMLLFGLGTIPLMLGFGIIASYTGRSGAKVFKQFSGVLLIFIALTTMSRGVALSGIQMNLSTFIPKSVTAQQATLQSVQQSGYQEVQFDLQPGNYADFEVKKGIPVKMNIRATDATLTGCNETVIIPAYNIEKKLEPGDNWIEFTPNESGTIPYSCWMGMINNTIKVVN